MTPIITVKTKNNSVYEFTTREGKTFFKRNQTLKGNIISFKKRPIISIGYCLHLEFYKTDDNSGEIKEITSSPVKEITVQFEDLH